MLGTCGSAGEGCTFPVTMSSLKQGPGSRAAGLAMAFKLIESAQGRWRAVNAPHLVALVRAGARFERGLLVERPEAVAA
jgi:putative transposase